MAWFAGSEGGLATTTAIIAGLMVTQTGRDVVVITAIISFLVQAFNASVVHYSAERTDDEIDREDKRNGFWSPAIVAVWHFLWHTAMSIFVLLPILLVTNQLVATVYSIGITLVLLFIVGAIKGRAVKRSPLEDGLELVILGALVICVGLLAGILLSE